MQTVNKFSELWCVMINNGISDNQNAETQLERFRKANCGNIRLTGFGR